MKRKIIKQGHSTLTITLPSEFTKRFNLEAGKEIDLVERDNGLFISTERKGAISRTELDITGMDIPTIWKYFMAIYREGYDEILVKFQPDSTIEQPYKFLARHKLDLKYKKEGEKRPITEALQGFVSRFIGFEIVEHGKDHVLIKEMGESTSKEFDNSLRRIFLLIQQMLEETIEAIKKSDPRMLDHMHDIDTNLDKFQDYCMRILNKTRNKDPKKTSLLFSVLMFLELIGDELKVISHHLTTDFPNSKFKVILDMAQSVKEQFDLYYEIFYKFDNEKIAKMSDLDKKRYFAVDQLYYKVKEDEVKEIFHHLRIIPRYLNSLTELRIEMEF